MQAIGLITRVASSTWIMEETFFQPSFGSFSLGKKTQPKKESLQKNWKTQEAMPLDLLSIYQDTGGK